MTILAYAVLVAILGVWTLRHAVRPVACIPTVVTDIRALYTTTATTVVKVTKTKQMIIQLLSETAWPYLRDNHALQYTA